MFAIIAAICFGLALLLDLLGEGVEPLFTVGTLTLLGFLFVALHLAGFAAAVRGRNWRRR
ncbi:MULTISPECIES: hypothetical protein [Catellatospora]|uniref:Uncharacterized protein n=3 Tax=Catellatospora TaxID=53365 RepID=A0A8J3LDV2_9ACTN|nr:MULTISPECIES: hypothetical protein [Catellatospora]RKE06335.1 hypothetical protein C8E86_1154 [Catellatospora citrea]GIF88090.1 hypothetical protein Cch02nite_15340 [Catellatospora chokoriensis]GIG01038.1 hypothetical protein Cci01nite_61310 [Catellatospora citrea]GIG18897.1 hypothetical protein Cme02nite_72290 [Catellatospora methionotrophica]